MHLPDSYGGACDSAAGSLHSPATGKFQTFPYPNMVDPRKTKLFHSPNMLDPRSKGMFNTPTCFILEKSNFSTSQAGKLLGNRNHSTIIYSVNKIKKELSKNVQLKAEIEKSILNN